MTSKSASWRPKHVMKSTNSSPHLPLSLQLPHSLTVLPLPTPPLTLPLPHLHYISSTMYYLLPPLPYRILLFMSLAAQLMFLSDALV